MMKTLKRLDPPKSPDKLRGLREDSPPFLTGATGALVRMRRAGGIKATVDTSQTSSQALDTLLPDKTEHWGV